MQTATIDSSDAESCAQWWESVAWEADPLTFLSSLQGLTTDQETDAVVERCRVDLGLFCLAYLPSRFPLPFNRIHRAFLADVKIGWEDRRVDVKRADAAPRGSAKSTVESWASLVHDVVYGLELFIGVASTDYDLSEDLAADLYEVFSEPEAYEALHADYGPFSVAGGKTDFVVRVPGGDPRGVRIKALSFGGSVRGKKHRGVRFTKLVLDDSEHPDKVRSASVREKTWEFLQKDILKAGQPGTTYRVLGTILHPDSMLARLMSSPAWSSRLWTALITWPDRMDLWESCRQLWADLGDADRLQTARAFYEANLDEMNAGASVVWPERESLWDLMLLWWENAGAFYSEKQNTSRDPTRQRFDVDRFRRCRFDGTSIHVLDEAGQVVRSVALTDCERAAWLDPAVGKDAKRGDGAALAYIARDPQGWRYVLSVREGRARPSEQRRWVWELFEQDSGCRFGLEDNGFQVLFSDDFEREKTERRNGGQAWRLEINGHTSTRNKESRIDRLEGPACVHGWLLFEVGLPGKVAEQFRDFPNAAHDDIPDAIERADWLLTQRAAVASFSAGW